MPTPKRITERRRLAWICLGLVGAVFAAYGQVAFHDFVGWDDGAYLTQNPRVYHGLTLEGTAWAFTTFTMGNWHPLTWISHMLDCELFGLQAGGHHLVSVGLHAVAAVALLLALLRMTGALWPATWVAALFALHPLRAESVAWAAERKDVLAAMFWMLALLAYAIYVKRGGALRYVWVLLAMALGLASKAMLVTLPFVLLLLDFWPLKRWSAPGAVRRLLLEKLPFFALAAAASGVGLLAQRAAGAVATTAGLSVASRLQNAMVSYMDYMRQTLWPAGLSYYYPHPDLIGSLGLSPGRVVAAVLLLAAVTLGVLAGWRSRPWLTVGWLWFVGTLVPVIGLVQLGMQARADRYTYVPSVGLLLMVGWSAALLVERAPRWRRMVAVAAMVSIAASAGATAMQVRHWRDSRALAERALAVTNHNFRAHDLLGIALEREGQLSQAAEQFRAALEIHPVCNSCRLNLAMVLGNLGYLDQGRALFEQALRVNPSGSQVAAHSGLGAILQRQGDLAGARLHLDRALELEPEFAEARNNLGIVHQRQGRLEQARAEFERAIRIAPDYALARMNFGALLLQLGDLDGAARQLERAIELESRLLEAHFKLAVVRVNRDELPAAVAGFERVLELDPRHVDALYNLGVVLDAMGQPTAAASYLQRLLAFDPQNAQARAALDRLGNSPQ